MKHLVRVLMLATYAALVLGGACSFGNSAASPGGSAGGAGSPTGAAGTTGAGGTSSSGTGQGGVGAVGSAGSTGAAGTGSFAGSTGSAGTTGAAGTTGGAGTTGAAGTAAGSMDGGAGGSAPCTLSIVRVDPGTRNEISGGLTNLVAAPSVQLSLEAKVSGSRFDAGASAWSWDIEPRGGVNASQRADGSTSVPFTSNAAGDVVAVTLGPGSYQVIVSNSIAGCSQALTTIEISAPPPPKLRFRVTPPASAQVPAREFEADGTNPYTLAELALCELGESMLTIAPKDARDLPIPAYVRITTPSFGAGIEGYTERGPLLEPLATSLPYRVLIVPDTAIAPLVVAGMPADIRAALTADQTSGTAVTGTARDGSGNAVAGARVVLRDGDRPSTLGTSAADGTFALATREGTLAADVTAPAGSGLPDAHVASTSGILVPPGTVSVTLTMTWAKVTSGVLSVSVVDANGAAVAGARVRADLAGTPPVVGTLGVHASSATLNDVTLPATGSAWSQATTDSSGVAQLGRLPAGPYHVIVAPPTGLTTAAITSADVMLAAAGLAAHVALASPVTYSGRLTIAEVTAGAKVTALDQGLLAAATTPTTTADDGGGYSLSLSAGRTYELLVEAPAGQPFWRNVFGVASPSASSLGNVSSVPAPRAWSGSVTCAGSGVAGALVQVYCAGASCIDATVLLSQGTTGVDGRVSLLLPGFPSGP